MTISDIELIIGARGWNYAQWQNTYYPDGLPEDWRLSYYSNEFSAVLVPWEYLREANPGKTQGWLDDTNQDFVFFIEVALHSSWERLFPVIEPLAPQLKGIYLRNVYSRQEDAEMAAVESLIRKVSELAPIIADPYALDAGLQAAVAAYNPGCYWRPDESDVTPCHADIALAETTLSTHHPRVLKKIIEDCCSGHGPTTIGFFMGGEEPSIDDVRNATMIWQMLG
jgi:hypothetical protein